VELLVCYEIASLSGMFPSTSIAVTESVDNQTEDYYCFYRLRRKQESTLFLYAIVKQVNMLQ
jgi:hypothetical protein